jgi:hypothetical protein
MKRFRITGNDKWGNDREMDIRHYDEAGAIKEAEGYGIISNVEATEIKSQADVMRDIIKNGPSVHTMSEGCFKQISKYIFNCYMQGCMIIGDTVQETKRNIMLLRYFQSGCFTYLQAEAFARHYHEDHKFLTNGQR